MKHLSAAPCRFGPLGVGVAGLIAGFAGSTAWADALTVSSAQTSPVTTAAASNGSAGDVTVASGGSIIVSTTGPALTIDSSNSLTNAGTIQSSAATGATAILVDGSGGIAGSISNSGVVGVTGTGGSGNYGIRIVNGSLTGSIASTTASSVNVVDDASFGVSVEAPVTGNILLNAVTVSGTGSTGVSLAAPLTGNLTLTGASSASGADATGLLTVAPISGGVIVDGSIASGLAATTTTDSAGDSVAVPAAAGIAGVHIASSVGGGFLNNRYYVDSTGAVVANSAATSSDTLVTGTISGISGTTAVLIAPLTGSGSDVVLSTVGAAGTDDGYGFVNRGTITSSGTASGTAATAIRIAGASGGSATVVVAQGLINQSNGQITSSTIDAVSTGIAIGAGASVPAIVNQGSIIANSSTSSSTTTTSARAIVVEAGGTVNSIVNSGTISVAVTGNGSAVAVLDQSGSVASIVNSGTISVTGDTAGTSVRAIDLSASNGAVTVSNSGKITGDIVFGTGNSVYSATSGSLDGTLSFGGGTNRLSLDGTTIFDSPLTLASGGSLAVDLAGSSSLTLSGSTPVLSSLNASGQSLLAIPVAATGSGLTLTGAASFTGQSSIKLVITQQIGAAPITVLSAAGGISTDHLSTLIGSTSTPFLYTLTDYAIDGDALTATLHQKTGLEAGFSTGTAPLFDQSMVAFGNGATFQAVANLPDQAALLAAYRQIQPPGFGSLPIRLAQSLQSAGAGVVRGRLDALAAAPGGATPDIGRLSPWIQEGVSLLRQSDSLDDPGFSSDNYTISLGADYALTHNLAVGVAGTFAWDQVRISGMQSVSTKPFSVDSQMADLYAGWHSGPFFAQIVGGYAHNRYDFRRQIDFSTVSTAQTARWSGHQLSGDLVGGMRFAFGRFTIEPSDSLSYIKLRQNGYTMTGGGDLDLAVDGKSDKAATNSARLAIGYKLPLSNEDTIRFSVRGAYVSQLDKSITPLTASFVAGGSSFEMASAALHGNAFQEGASVAYEMSGFYLGLAGDRRQESGYTDTSLTLTLRAAF